MDVIPKYSRCGKNIGLFKSTSLCPACVESERIEQESAKRKLEEEAKRKQLIKVEHLRSVITNPLASLLIPHIDSPIRINFAAPDSSDKAVLRGVTEAYFTVEIGQHCRIHVPFSQVLHIVESSGKPPS